MWVTLSCRNGHKCSDPCKKYTSSWGRFGVDKHKAHIYEKDLEKHRHGWGKYLAAHLAKNADSPVEPYVELCIDLCDKKDGDFTPAKALLDDFVKNVETQQDGTQSRDISKLMKGLKLENIHPTLWPEEDDAGDAEDADDRWLLAVNNVGVF